MAQATTDWIEWNGGNRPVDAYTLVDVKRFGGRADYGFAARHINWVSRSQHPRTPGVIAYRVVSA